MTLKQKNQEFNDQYTLEKHNYDRLLMKTKSSFYERRLQDSDNKQKTMWAICNELRGPTNTDKNFPKEGDPYELANDYTTYISELIPQLLENVQNVNFKCSIEENNRSMFLQPTTEEKIMGIIRNLKSKHSYGENEIPVSLIKPNAENLSYIYTLIYNKQLA